jgi:hypothetical protein
MSLAAPAAWLLRIKYVEALTSDALGRSQEFRLGFAWWPAFFPFTVSFRLVDHVYPPNSAFNRVLLDIRIGDPLLFPYSMLIVSI